MAPYPAPHFPRAFSSILSSLVCKRGELLHCTKNGRDGSYQFLGTTGCSRRWQPPCPPGEAAASAGASRSRGAPSSALSSRGKRCMNLTSANTLWDAPSSALVLILFKVNLYCISGQGLLAHGKAPAQGVPALPSLLRHRVLDPNHRGQEGLALALSSGGRSSSTESKPSKEILNSRNAYFLQFLIYKKNQVQLRFKFIITVIALS